MAGDIEGVQFLVEEAGLDPTESLPAGRMGTVTAAEAAKRTGEMLVSALIYSVVLMERVGQVQGEMRRLARKMASVQMSWIF